MNMNRLKFFLFLLILICFLVVYNSILNRLFLNQPKTAQLAAPCAQKAFTRYLDKYPFLLDCKNTYSSWTQNDPKSKSLDYRSEAPKSYWDLRITRAVTIYFPVDKLREFEYEFKWLYRSWLEMITYEPAKWRTDLVVFIENDPAITDSDKFFFQDLNCTFENIRERPSDLPMCTLVAYVPITKRALGKDKKAKFGSAETGFLEDYQQFLNKVDVFSLDKNHLMDYYRLIKSSLANYSYTDSILMAFDGYDYFKRAGFDFLVRSDMDVFLTPLFATWLPLFCNDFYVGGGGYSNTFNSKRFRRIASNLGLAYGANNNLGSTWYSTPHQFRLVSYLTLLGMAYLRNEEFAEPEKNGKLGTLLWPEWHYGVLLLYGQHLMLNHLIGSEQLNVVRLEEFLDHPSGNNRSVYKMIHIHVFQGQEMFSKLAFRMGKYDKMINNMSAKKNKTLVCWYTLQMALEGKFLKEENMIELASLKISNKN